METVTPEPTIIITSITFARNYGQTLVQARGAMRLDGYVEEDVNDQNFPLEGRDEDREFVLVCFNREIDDSEDPAKSELLRELGGLGLQPEGPMELCFVGADERTRDLQRKFPIVSRRQVWQGPRGRLVCSVLHGHPDRRDQLLYRIRRRWLGHFRFLCSRKPSK